MVASKRWSNINGMTKLLRRQPEFMYVAMKRKKVFTSKRAENKAASRRCVHGGKWEREANAPCLLRLTWLYNKLREQIHLRVSFH